jgi:hypothetical protein
MVPVVLCPLSVVRGASLFKHFIETATFPDHAPFIFFKDSEGLGWDDPSKIKGIRLDRVTDSFYVMRTVSISDKRPCVDPSE